MRKPGYLCSRELLVKLALPDGGSHERLLFMGRGLLRLGLMQLVGSDLWFCQLPKSKLPFLLGSVPVVWYADQLLQPLALLRGRLYNSGGARVAHW